MHYWAAIESKFGKRNAKLFTGPQRLSSLALFWFACLALAACASKPSDLQIHASQSKQRDQTQEKKHFKPEGDFADGTSINDVLGGLKTRDTIAQFLDKHAARINLKSMSEYLEKPTRDDLMIFKSRDCSFLKALDLAEMGITDSTLEGISDLRLTTLFLANNELKDLHAVKDMKSLNNLDVSGCPIDRDGITVISGLSNLQFLTLSNTAIDDNDLEALKNLKSLTAIAVMACPKLTARAVRQFQSSLPNCKVSQSLSGDESGFSDIGRIQASLISDGDYDEADASLHGLIHRWQALSPVPYSWIVRAYRYRARCQLSVGRSQEACHMFDTCLSIATEHTPDNAEIPSVQVEYAELLEKLGRLKEAVVQRKAADQFCKRHASQTQSLPAVTANQNWLAKHH